jgi:probable HAF family extracellular repeat protein
MKHRIVSFVILTLALWLAQSSAAWAGGYRLFQLNDEGDSREVIATDLNNRGEVVGSRSRGSGPLYAFRWRNGEYTDVHEAVAPSSNFTQAAGINDLSTIVGFRTVPNFEGFVLRGSRVAPLQVVVAGERDVFPNDINNRGQIIVDSFGGSVGKSWICIR